MAKTPLTLDRNNQFRVSSNRISPSQVHLEIEVLVGTLASHDNGSKADMEMGRSQCFTFLRDLSYFMNLHLTFSYAHESRTNSVHVSFSTSLISQPSQPQQPHLCQGVWRVLPVAQ
jgi:hypothetical protein